MGAGGATLVGATTGVLAGAATGVLAATTGADAVVTGSAVFSAAALACWACTNCFSSWAFCCSKSANCFSITATSSVAVVEVFVLATAAVAVVATATTVLAERPFTNWCMASADGIFNVASPYSKFGLWLRKACGLARINACTVCAVLKPSGWWRRAISKILSLACTLYCWAMAMLLGAAAAGVWARLFCMVC